MLRYIFTASEGNVVFTPLFTALLVILQTSKMRSDNNSLINQLIYITRYKNEITLN